MAGIYRTAWRTRSSETITMSLYIDIRVNDRIVATAAVRNIAEPGDLSNYRGESFTNAFDGHPDRSQEVKIFDHDRRQNVWSLVAKIAKQLEKKTVK